MNESFIFVCFKATYRIPTLPAAQHIDKVGRSIAKFERLNI